MKEFKNWVPLIWEGIKGNIRDAKLGAHDFSEAAEEHLVFDIRLGKKIFPAVIIRKAGAYNLGHCLEGYSSENFGFISIELSEENKNNVFLKVNAKGKKKELERKIGDMEDEIRELKNKKTSFLGDIERHIRDKKKELEKIQQKLS